MVEENASSDELDLEWYHFIGLIIFFPLGIYITIKLRRWYKKKIILDQINEQYETLRSARGDVVYHYHWSVEDHDRKSASQHESHVMEIDEKLQKLRETYSKVEDDIVHYEDINLKQKEEVEKLFTKESLKDD